jgi:hypothetical protein
VRGGGGGGGGAGQRRFALPCVSDCNRCHDLSSDELLSFLNQISVLFERISLLWQLELEPVTKCDW